MFNGILWTLDNETDGALFERLCTDLLFRNGYKDIVPVGKMHDRGRDAEIVLHEGRAANGSATFFQYSLAKEWRPKLLSELRKVSANGHKISKFIFVTSRDVSGRDRDELQREVEAQYSWQLYIYSREWLRLQLEEAHPDLAVKYLGVQPARTSESVFGASRPALEGLDDGHRLYASGDYEAAAVAFKNWLRVYPQDLESWLGLCWSQYSLYRYDEALISINRAEELAPTSSDVRRAKGCILAEAGIRFPDRARLLLAKEIFKEAVLHSQESIDHFNYANTLDALGEIEAAREAYIEALRLNPGHSETWKNLGSVYHKLGDHAEEMKCFNRALSIRPDLVEGLVSKGVTLLIDCRRPLEALGLLRRAMEIDETYAERWPHIWYWLAEACHRAGSLEEALEYTEHGLRNNPSHEGLLRLKGHLLCALWKHSTDYQVAAKRHLAFLLSVDPGDSLAVSGLVKILGDEGDVEGAWDLILKTGGSRISVLKTAGYNLDQCLTVVECDQPYARFRESYPALMYGQMATSFGLAQNKEFVEAFMAVGAVPFSQGLTYILRFPRPQRVKHLKGLWRTISTALEPGLLSVCPDLVSDVSGSPDDQVSDGLAKLILFVFDLVLREVSRQYSYIAGSAGVPAQMVEAALPKGRALSEWALHAAVEGVMQAGSSLGFFAQD